MKNLLRSKKWTAAAIGFVFLMLAGMIALGARYCFVTDFYEEQTMFLEGEYSVDGGAWQPIDNERQITERFHSVVFRGTLPEFEYEYFSGINLYSKNIWYTLKTADGAYLDGYTAEDRLYESGNSLAALMPNTPGYAVKTLELDILKESGVAQDTVLVFEAEYPYPVAERSFSDLFRATCSDANGAYLQFFFEALPSVLLFALVCFFGIFMFPIAGFIMGKTNYRYLTFGALCFIWGLFMIGQKVSRYLNLWITDHTVCMMIEILCHATYDEIASDYMITYDNYYQVNEKGDKYKYDLILDSYLNDMLRMLAQDKEADVRNLDLEECGRSYLRASGMSDEEIDALVNRFTQE